MSSDYDRGYRHEGGGSSMEYERGQQDAWAGKSPDPLYLNTTKPADVGGGADMSGVEAASEEVGRLWVKNPDSTVKAMVRVLAGFTVLGGIIGFLVGNWLHDPNLWLPYAKFFFFFDGLIVAAQLLGATLVGRGTKRGTLTLLFVGGSVAFMIWAYMLYPAVFIHLR